MKLSGILVFFLFLTTISFSSNAQSKAGDCEFVKKGVAVEVPACASAPELGTITCETCPSDACQEISISLPSNAVILEVIPFVKRTGYRGNWGACDQFSGECVEQQGKNYYSFIDGYQVKPNGSNKIISWKFLNGHPQNSIVARIDVVFVLN